VLRSVPIVFRFQLPLVLCLIDTATVKPVPLPLPSPKPAPHKQANQALTATSSTPSKAAKPSPATPGSASNSTIAKAADTSSEGSARLLQAFSQLPGVVGDKDEIRGVRYSVLVRLLLDVHTRIKASEVLLSLCRCRALMPELGTSSSLAKALFRNLDYQVSLCFLLSSC
jgi:hypothetical protein